MIFITDKMLERINNKSFISDVVKNIGDGIVTYHPDSKIWVILTETSNKEMLIAVKKAL